MVVREYLWQFVVKVKYISREVVEMVQKRKGFSAKTMYYGFRCFQVVMILGLVVVAVLVGLEISQEGFSSSRAVTSIALLVVDCVIIVVCFRFLWRKVFVAHAFVLARRDFYQRTSQVYLWGYPLSETIKAELPQRLGNYHGSGFCHEFAAVTMYALKGVKTARLCHGIHPKYGYHSWVEYYKYGLWWVADLAWACQEYVPWPRWIYRKELAAETESVCKYKEFWQGSFAEVEKVLADLDYETQDLLPYDLIVQFMNDPSFYALDDTGNATD